MGTRILTLNLMIKHYNDTLNKDLKRIRSKQQHNYKKIKQF